MLPPMALPSLSWMLLSCFMLLSQVQGEEPQKDLPSARIRCPKGSKAYGSHCYALFLSPKSRMAADKRPSGNLVSVLRGAEGSFMSSLVRSISNSYSYVWIGLHDPTQVRVYPLLSWSSTDVMNDFTWEKNPSTILNPGHCRSLSRSTGFLKWKDYNCDAKLPYVCKFKD
uniref:C-type lectin domain-containing protein n=1 Tax=Colobus angolensis palliatus TaxID=336983 RepID=A0A2K5K051_COLAP